jgi:hypothetical protein
MPRPVPRRRGTRMDQLRRGAGHSRPQRVRRRLIWNRLRNLQILSRIDRGATRGHRHDAGGGPGTATVIAPEVQGRGLTPNLGVGSVKLLRSASASRECGCGGPGGTGLKVTFTSPAPTRTPHRGHDTGQSDHDPGERTRIADLKRRRPRLGAGHEPGGRPAVHPARPPDRVRSGRREPRQHPGRRCRFG